jgi:hypothetical protein
MQVVHNTADEEEMVKTLAAPPKKKSNVRQSSMWTIHCGY